MVNYFLITTIQALLRAATEWKIRYVEDQCLNYVKNNKNDFKNYRSMFERNLKINEGIFSFIINNFWYASK